MPPVKMKLNWCDEWARELRARDTAAQDKAERGVSIAWYIAVLMWLGASFIPVFIK